MEHRKVSGLLLLAGGVAGIGGGALLFGFVPLAALEMRREFPEWAGWFWPGMMYAWGLGVLCLLALWYYFRISLRIGKNQSFCAENARDLRRIAALLLTAAGLVVAGAALLLILQMGPLFLYLLLAAMACGAMGMLAYALSRLLFRAVQLQEENDLTV